MGVYDVGRLPQRDRIAVAQIVGAATRYGDHPAAGAIEELHEVSRDPRLLGYAAGTLLVDPHRVRGPAVDLLRQAGADMPLAEARAAEVRERLRAADRHV